MNTGLKAIYRYPNYHITFFRLRSWKSAPDGASCLTNQRPWENASGALPFAGIRRLFVHFIKHHKAQPRLRSADRRTAEKKTHLARRRGGGTTARARCEQASLAHLVARQYPETQAAHRLPLASSPPLDYCTNNQYSYSD